MDVVIGRGRLAFTGPGLPRSDGEAFVLEVLSEAERVLDGRPDLPGPIVIPRLAIDLVVERDAHLSLAVLLGRALADQIVRALPSMDASRSIVGRTESSILRADPVQLVEAAL